MERWGQRIKTGCWAAAILSPLVYFALGVGPIISHFARTPFLYWIPVLVGQVMPCLPFVVLLVHYKLRSHGDAPPARPVLISIAVAGMVTLVVTLGLPASLPSQYGYDPNFAWVVPLVTVPVMVACCALTWFIASMESKKTMAITCGLLLLVMLFLAWRMHSAIVTAQMVHSMSNARSFGQCLLAKELEFRSLNVQSNVYPRTGQFRTSTEYFRFVMTNGWLEGFDYTFFGGPGLSQMRNATNTAEFTSNHNAWCVVLDVDDHSPSVMPPFFTRNLAFTGATLDTFVGLYKNVKPHGDRGGVVVTIGGAGCTFEKDELPFVKDGRIMFTNAFLRP